MAGRDSTNGSKRSRNAKVRRRRIVILGGALGACAAAAAMATGSVVTAAHAKADFEDLLDPIIQPLVTSLSDAIAGFDPAAATDLTSWSDSLLSSLNSLDVGAALPSTAEPAASAAASPASDPSGTYDIPITMAEDTEPTVQATVDGANTTELVDTGSSGLVIPETDLGSNFLTQLESLIELGVPSGIGESGYSGGVDYIYLTYDNVPVDYATVGGGTLDTTTPVEVEVYSWDPGNLSSLFTNDAFQNFLGDNDVNGILGIGDDTSGGAGESPIEAAGYDGVTVDLDPSSPNYDQLIVESTPDTSGVELNASGSTVSGLTEDVSTLANDGGTNLGSGTVSDDLDSGGVYGTIPSSINDGTVPQGDWVTVYDGPTELYSYQVETDSLGDSEAPIDTSGTSIDSGVLPFSESPISIDYNNDTLYLNN
jgi:hypothetical protein